jgi:pimeloyl-ACP methyl ester carboxylesterase
MKINQLSIENTKYNYRISTCTSSDYPPIFLVNGAFQNMHSWDYLVSFLKDYFTIIVADLPGWGSADLLPSSHDFSLLASAVNQILEVEKIEQVNLISTSYGSLIGTIFAQEYGEKLSNLMLCSPLLEISGSLKVYYPELLEIISKKDTLVLSDFLCKVGLLNCVAGCERKIDHFEKLTLLFKRKIEKLTEEDLAKFIHNTDRILSFGKTDLSAIKHVNTKVITGEYDSFTTPEYCRKVARSFTSNNFESIPRADHMFLFERPKAFADIILKYFCVTAVIAERLRA